MTRAEYLKNYKLLRKLSLDGFLWICGGMASAGIFLCAFFDRMGWLLLIFSLMIWAICFSFIGAIIETKKIKKYNLLCPHCGKRIISPSIIIATGKCIHCKTLLFDETLPKQPKMGCLGLTGTKFKAFQRRFSFLLYFLLCLWGISMFFCLFWLSYFKTSDQNQIICVTISLSILPILFFVALLEIYFLQKKGFVCPSCNAILYGRRGQIAVKTGNCARCGNHVFSTE